MVLFFSDIIGCVITLKIMYPTSEYIPPILTNSSIPYFFGSVISLIFATIILVERKKEMTTPIINVLSIIIIFTSLIAILITALNRYVVLGYFSPKGVDLLSYISNFVVLIVTLNNVLSTTIIFSTMTEILNSLIALIIIILEACLVIVLALVKIYTFMCSFLLELSVRIFRTYYAFMIFTFLGPLDSVRSLVVLLFSRKNHTFVNSTTDKQSNIDKENHDL